MGKVDMYDYIKVLSICITNENGYEKLRWKSIAKTILDIIIYEECLWTIIYIWNIWNIYISSVCINRSSYILWNIPVRKWAENVSIQLIKESNEKMLTPLNQMQIHPLSFYWASVPSLGPVTNASDKVLALELALYMKGEIRMNK